MISLIAIRIVDVCACMLMLVYVQFFYSQPSKDEIPEKSRRKHTDTDRHVAKDTDTVRTRESQREKRRTSRSSSKEQRRTGAGESSRFEKNKKSGSAKHRSLPSRERSPSHSSSDSEVVYGKVLSKVDVRRSELDKEGDRGKHLQKRSASPVSASNGKGHFHDRVDSKSTNQWNKEDEAKTIAGRSKKVSASYSSDSSASQSPEQSGRRVQSTIVEKLPPATTQVTSERRKIVASQKPVELAPAKSLPKSTKHDLSDSEDHSPASHKHVESQKARSPEQVQKVKKTQQPKKKASEILPEKKSASKVDRQELLEKTRKKSASSSRHRSRSSSLPDRRKKAERYASSDSHSSSAERLKPKAKSSHGKKKILTRRSSSYSSESSRQESLEVHRSREKLSQREKRSKIDGKSDTQTAVVEPVVSTSRQSKKDRSTEVHGEKSHRKIENKMELSTEQKEHDREKSPVSSKKTRVTVETASGNSHEFDTSRIHDDRRETQLSPRAIVKHGEKDDEKQKTARQRASSSSSSASASSKNSAPEPAKKPVGHADAKPSTVEMRQQRPLVAASDSESESHSRTPPMPRSAFHLSQNF